MAMLSAQPVFILRDVLQDLSNQRIVAPGYTCLQDMVERTVTTERLRLTRLFDEALTPEVERPWALAPDDDIAQLPAGGEKKSALSVLRLIRVH